MIVVIGRKRRSYSAHAPSRSSGQCAKSTLGNSAATTDMSLRRSHAKLTVSRTLSCARKGHAAGGRDASAGKLGRAVWTHRRQRRRDDEGGARDDVRGGGGERLALLLSEGVRRASKFLGSRYRASTLCVPCSRRMRGTVRERRDSRCKRTAGGNDGRGRDAPARA